MPKTLYVEKPGKTLAEQYRTGAPLPAGVCTCNLQAADYVASGFAPHVHFPAGVTMLQDTDWLLADRWTEVLTAILTAAQFDETYGSGPPAPLTEGVA